LIFFIALNNFQKNRIYKGLGATALQLARGRRSIYIVASIFLWQLVNLQILLRYHRRAFYNFLCFQKFVCLLRKKSMSICFTRNGFTPCVGLLRFH